MALNILTKGTPDWHIPINSNFQEIEKGIGHSLQRPKTSDAGVLYHNSDGTTSVIPTIPKEQYVYGVVVKDDANPSAVYYTDDCVGFVPASAFSMGSWDSSPMYRDIKPCVIGNNGVVNYYLQKNDYTKKEDGSASILTGADGNVMVEFPKMYWDMKRIGTDLYIRIGNHKFSETAVCYAHTDGLNVRDKIYISAYKTSGIAGNQSISGQKPTVSQSISWFRSAARSIGTRWNIGTFYSKVMLEILSLMIYKGRDMQNLLGNGFTYGNAASATTGTTNSDSFCFGYKATNDGKQQIKFLGLEDYYGNVWEFVDGLVSNKYTIKATADTSKFNDAGNGYEMSVVSGFSSTVLGSYTIDVQGTNNFGFITKSVGGSEVTYYSDGFWIDNTTVGKDTTIALFGGSWVDAGRAGSFCWSLSNAASILLVYFGARLCFI